MPSSATSELELSDRSLDELIPPALPRSHSLDPALTAEAPAPSHPRPNGQVLPQSDIEGPFDVPPVVQAPYSVAYQVKETLEGLYDSEAHRFQLEIWEKEEETLRWQLGRKEANRSSSQNEIYQLFGLYFLFQGVIFTSVAQSSALSCSHWWSPFSLSLIVSLATVVAIHQKLLISAQFQKELDRDRLRSNAVFDKIDGLRKAGRDYDLNDPLNEPRIPSQPQPYSFRNRFEKILPQFVFTYGGAVTVTLLVFSAVIMTSCYRILCHSCKCRPPCGCSS